MCTVVHGGLSRCKTRNTTTWIMLASSLSTRPVSPSLSHSPCTELRGAPAIVNRNAPLHVSAMAKDMGELSNSDRDPSAAKGESKFRGKI